MNKILQKNEELIAVITFNNQFKFHYISKNIRIYVRIIMRKDVPFIYC